MQQHTLKRIARYKRKAKDLRIIQILKGNGCKTTVHGIYRNVRFDSGLEFAFLKWYWEKHPDAKIERCDFSLTDGNIKYVPDFRINNTVIVEVKASITTDAMVRVWKTYKNTQRAKRKMLKQHGEFIWFTDKICGQNFYKKALKEAKELIKMPI